MQVSSYLANNLLVIGLCFGLVTSPVMAQQPTDKQLMTFGAGLSVKQKKPIEGSVSTYKSPLNSDEVREILGSSGTSNFPDVSARARQIGSPGGCPDANLTCIELTIKNSGTEVVIVEGSRATIKSGSDNDASLLTPDAIANSVACRLTPGKKALVAGIYAVTFGFWGPIAYEKIKGDKGYAVLSSQSWQRNKLEEVALGRRLVFPGEVSTGLICCSCREKPSTVEVPISYWQRKSTVGRLSLSVEPEAAMPLHGTEAGK
jgi:hypothetical protein